jgi:hypothetical protein
MYTGLRETTVFICIQFRAHNQRTLIILAPTGVCFVKCIALNGGVESHKSVNYAGSCVLAMYVQITNKHLGVSVSGVGWGGGCWNHCLQARGRRRQGVERSDLYSLLGQSAPLFNCSYLPGGFYLLRRSCLTLAMGKKGLCFSCRCL